MLVSFAIVAYNEERSLPRLLDDLVRQDYPHEKIEVLLIDSMSTDATASIMRDFQKTAVDFQAVRLLKNEKKTLPCGCNVMLENAAGDAIVRVDAHASIPSDFIRAGVRVLEEGEYISGGQVSSVCTDDTALARTLLSVENSAFGGGTARFRRATRREYVSTMAFAFYRREVFAAAGPYNENLARTEDNDMSYRIRRAGFRFCCDPSITSTRFNRSTLGGMLRQKYLNGYWIGKTMGINPRCFSVYHFVPFLFVLGIVFTAALAAVGHPFLMGLMWLAYALAVLAATAAEIAGRRFAASDLLMPFLFLLLHLSYGAGTLVGLIEMPFWVRGLKRKEKR